MRDGPLHDLARAMLYTMPGSPRVELEPLIAACSPARPICRRPRDLARLARARGAESLPDLPDAQRLYGLAGQPRRARPRPIRGDAVADALEPLIQPLIRDDQPVEAEALLDTRIAELSDEARTAFQQRIAWVYFLNGNDRDARRIADLAARAARPNMRSTPNGWPASPPGGWAITPPRPRISPPSPPARPTSSSPPPAIIGRRAPTPPAAIPSGSRRGCGPRRGSARPSTACSRRARSACAAPPADMATFTESDWRALTGNRNVRAAIALAEIGETQLAADLIRHQARIGNPRDHEHLIHLAARLNLTATQMYLVAQRPARQPLRPGRALSDAVLAADARLAGRSGPGLRPRPPGIATSGPTR